MNAYELADLMLDVTDCESSEYYQAGLMLRQQADRIAELEKLVHQRFDDGKRLGVIETEDRLKQQSAEPVAWTNQKWLDGIAKEPQLFQPLFVHGKQTEHNTIPLYTTPQIKELSDEELNKAFDYYCETDEGVLRFNYELRDEWKKEQLIRWKEAFKKASEK
jgi:hypothetical protein